MSDVDWVEVGSGVANSTPGSNVDIFLSLDGPPICENMTDAEFRRTVFKLRDDAVKLVERRVRELTRWDSSARTRVAEWFGKRDEATRQHLIAGLTSELAVLLSLGPKNFMRSSPELDAYLGCLPNTKGVRDEVAHVCAPNITNRVICISPKFCTLRNHNMYADSRLSTIIHEVTHFIDTFGARDHMYSVSSYLAIWGRSNPGLAIENADSIAGYVTYGEEF